MSAESGIYRILLTWPISFGAPSRSEKLETDLYLPFATILQSDVQGMAALFYQRSLNPLTFSRVHTICLSAFRGFT